MSTYHTVEVDMSTPDWSCLFLYNGVTGTMWMLGSVVVDEWFVWPVAP